MAEWETAFLSDVLDFREGPGVLAKDFRHVGVPLVRLAGLKRGAHLLEGCNYLDPKDVERRWSHFRLLEGDVLLSTSASLGEVATVTAEGVGAIPYTGIIGFRPKGKKVLAGFIQYMLTDPRFKEQISAMGVGSVMKHFGPSHLRSMRVSFPAPGQQRAIAEVLGALDDKIAANERVIRLVDELLSDVFARMSAPAPKTRLADLANINALTTRPQPAGQLRYLDISAISVGSYEMPEPIGWADAPGRARRVLRDGDTVWSTVRPNRRSHALVLGESEELVGSTGLAVISPILGRVASVYECTRTGAFVRYLESVAEGSAYPAVRGDRFLDAPVPQLTPGVWDQFEALALPMRQRVGAAMRENRALAAARDELLPLLMSGRIRVQDAEKVVEEVV